MRGKSEVKNILSEFDRSSVTQTSSSNSDNAGFETQQRPVLGQQLESFKKHTHLFINMNGDYFSYLCALNSSSPSEAEEESNSEEDTPGGWEEPNDLGEKFLRGREMPVMSWYKKTLGMKIDSRLHGFQSTQEGCMGRSEISGSQYQDTSRLIEEMSFMKQNELENCLELAKVTTDCANKTAENRQLEEMILKLQTSDTVEAEEFYVKKNELNMVLCDLKRKITHLGSIDNSLWVAPRLPQQGVYQGPPIMYYRGENVRFLRKIEKLEQENGRLCGVLADIATCQSAEARRRNILRLRLYDLKRGMELLMKYLSQVSMKMKESRGVCYGSITGFTDAAQTVDEETRFQNKTHRGILMYLEKLQLALDSCEKKLELKD